jgi:hypothetical protein
MSTRKPALERRCYGSRHHVLRDDVAAVTQGEASRTMVGGQRTDGLRSRQHLHNDSHSAQFINVRITRKLGTPHIPSFLSPITPTLPHPGAHVPQPLPPSSPQPHPVLRDTLCSCEAHGMKSTKKKKKKKEKKKEKKKKKGRTNHGAAAACCLPLAHSLDR